MPIYEYECKDCQTRFDALRSMKEADASIDCSVCASTHTARMISVFAAHSGGRAVAGTGASAGCGSCNSSCSGSCSH